MIKSIKEWLNLNYYTSALDQFLAEFDQKYPKLSASQCKEKAKYARIYKLRDDPNAPPPKTSFWDKLFRARS